MSLCIRLHRFVWFGAISVLAGCGAKAPPPTARDATVVSPAIILRPSEILPIYLEDLSVGTQSAPITIVAFLDLECPFCAKGWDTVVHVQQRFGSEKVRVVVKHLPLPFHVHAKPAARRALELQRRHGNTAAFSFLRRVLEAQSELSEETLEAWAEQSKPAVDQLQANRTAPLSIEEQLQRDAALATQLGIDGTPEFRINGISLPGAVSEAEFERVIALELQAVSELTRSGMPAGDVYPSRVAANHSTGRPNTTTTEPVDGTRWSIPVGSSPQLGPTEAPVTIVAFMDYECPFTRRGFQNLQELQVKYPGKLRLVWKHRPLQFHPNAEAASALAIWVRRARGEDAFWKVTERLLVQQDDLAHLPTWSSLDAFGIDRSKLVSLTAEMRTLLYEDVDLADDFEVDGTPQFFVNGRRVKGSRSVEDFSTLVDQELAQTESLRQSGTPDSEIYSALTAAGQKASEPARVAAETQFPDGPSAGAKLPKVTIRMFSDYQCPFCQQAESTIRQLLEEYPQDLRVVWYDLPLAFHDRARAAATLAREVRAQRGDAAFYRINQLLFEKQGDLSEPALIAYAKQLGVDENTLLPTRREQRHGAAIDRDLKLAEQLGISATPTFIVEQFVLEGAQSKHRFERLIRRVLSQHSKTKARTGKQLSGATP